MSEQKEARSNFESKVKKEIKGDQDYFLEMRQDNFQSLFGEKST